MVSPRGKHSLVTYNSDGSDNEQEAAAPTDAFNDVSDLMSISPASMESSGGPSNEVSPKVDNVKCEIPKKRIKKNPSANSMKGLVSYGMDEDDTDDDENDENDLDPEMESYDQSLQKDSRDNTQSSLPEVDNEELFNNDGRESDEDNEEPPSTANHDDASKKPPNDLKAHSGTSSSKVKATVVTERPSGSDLAYLLSRQVFNSPDGNITLPSPSPARPATELAARIDDLLAKARNSRGNPTEAILKNKAYRNPSIYEKLIQHMQIDERGTNYPPELYDPYRFGEEAYYEVLARGQDQAERRRLEMEGAGTGRASGTRPQGETRAVPVAARRTKWDAGTVPAKAAHK